MRPSGRRGFTLIEIVIVIVLIGALTAVALPYFRSSTIKADVRGAVDAIAAMHAVAKASAIQRGRSTRFYLTAGPNFTVHVEANNVAGGVDTVGRVEDLGSRFGVQFTTTRPVLTFTPRGIGGDPGSTRVVVTKGSVADTVTISAAGRLLR